MPIDPASIETWWSRPASELLAALASSREGLGAAEAARRLDAFGPNELEVRRPLSALRLLARQLENPLVLILIVAAAISALVGEWSDALVVLLIVVASGAIGFFREYDAGRALEKLRERVKILARVLRDGTPRSIPAAEVVPGDVVLLSAGSLVPGDGVVLEANDFFVSQAVLTGESFPVEKQPGTAPLVSSLPERTGCVFLGTSARSGTARCLIVRTGRSTAFGAIAGRLSLRPPETEFDRGLRHFGYLLARVMSVMVLAVFALNVFAHRPVIESLLFAVALAVGLTPELLPAILSVNLARSAQGMARHGVLVRRLNAIENFGAMDVLCTDKTGTLTEGVVRLDAALDPEGRPSDEVLRWASLNASLQTGLENPLDQAILERGRRDLAGSEKLDEIPYDFVRKRMTVVVREGGRARMLTKGALANVLQACSRSAGTGEPALDEARRQALIARFEAWSAQGLRVLGVAVRDVAPQAAWHREDERDMVFAGFLLFLDPPKPGVDRTLSELAALGVRVKIITGDNRSVARHAAAAVGMKVGGVVTGGELDEMRDEALWHAAEQTDLFAEVDPNQKERIILALKKTGHVVGYMGDGINDAPALHCADVSISVEKAVDVAKEAADFVLLERDMDVLRNGILEGRKTFANTLKYILAVTSANFGNMLSMALASTFLPFLPLLAKQILLNNFLSDVPAMALAGDAVDRELVDHPRRWDMHFIRRFMVEFGLLSSAFDFLTFGALLWIFRAPAAEFRTAWFVESLMTELAVALVVRTRRPSFRSRPGRGLWISTLAVALLAVAFPYLPFAGVFGFVPLPASLILAVLGITGAYVVATEMAKASFYRRALG